MKHLALTVFGMLLFTILLLWLYGCGTGGPYVYYSKGANHVMSESTANDLADEAELYFKTNFGINRGWTEHVNIRVLSERDAIKACPLSAAQMASGWTEAGGCTYNPWTVILNDAGPVEETLLHEFGNVAGMRFFNKENAELDPKFNEYFTKYIFEVTR